MPASPSFPSDARSSKWKKRKRDPQIPRKPKPQEEDDDNNDDDDADLDPEDDDTNYNNNEPHLLPNSAPYHHPAPAEVLSDGGVRVCDFPAVVRRAVNRPHSSVLAVVELERGDTKNQAAPIVLENVSYGQLQALSAVPSDSPALGAGDQDRGDGGAAPYVITPPQIMEGRGVVKKFGNNRLHVVPMHADWFSPSSVHRLERQVVPQFFSGKNLEHTPEKYIECRNGIVAKYMENPEKRLSVADCRGVVVGIDADDLARIVRFLDHWGIINYCATAPNLEPQSCGSYLREDVNGEVHVPSAALKSIDSLIQFDKPKCRQKATDVYSSVSFHGEDVSDLDSRIRERLSEHRCSCCSQSIPAVYYQSQKEVDILLCLDCFHAGRFVIGHSSIDFLRVDSTADYGDLDGESWTDQETLLLLEAMEIYHDNWNEIAEHVGTKSKSQCILHFIRLPMEGGLWENIEVPGQSVSTNSSYRLDRGGTPMNSNGDSEGSCFADADPESRLPFVNSANPVMSLVAFLASAVGPRVAAACAHASLSTLSGDDPLAASRNVVQMEGSGLANRINMDMCSKEGSSHGDITNSNQQKEAAPLSAEKVKAAAKAGLAAAAMKAKLFADHEEREIQRLSANIINHQLKRLELKLKQFAEVETMLMKECEQVERARQRFAAERARIVSTRFGPPGISSPSSLPGPGVAPTVINNNTAKNRQQVISPSPSQPIISGFGNNQPVHPHMSFMPRPQMFGLGPRLPLAAINTSSSAPSTNVTFSAPGNSQPALTHPMLRPISGTSSGLG